MNDHNTTVVDRYADIHNSYLAGQTLAEIGERHGITRERVRQLLEAEGVDRRTQTEAAALRNRQLAGAHREAILDTYRTLKTVHATVDAFKDKVPVSVIKDIINELPVAARPVRRPVSRRSFDDATCRARLAEAADAGATTIVAYREWRDSPAGKGAPSAPLLIMRYGSWRNALDAAGITAHNTAGNRRTFDDSDIRNSVHRFVAACDASDVYPSAQRYDEWARHVPGAPQLATIRMRTNAKWIDLVLKARAGIATETGRK